VKISTHCFAVTGLGFPPWEVNAGFVVGGRTTLVVDTGPSDLAARTVYGYASNVRPGNDLLAVNTELHVDHLLGNALFHDRSVPLWGHERCERSADALDQNADELIWLDGSTVGDGAGLLRCWNSRFGWSRRRAS
jgi:glyoxylase-like metal-dependent hydrolase (beta-lactamase superfamily II)